MVVWWYGWGAAFKRLVPPARLTEMALRKIELNAHRNFEPTGSTKNTVNRSNESYEQ